MATIEVMQATSALPPQDHVPVKQDISTALGALSISSQENELFRTGKTCDVLELFIAHLEAQLNESEEITSPTDIPSGIQDMHSKQIEVCLARFKAAKVPTVSIREYFSRLHQHCPFSTPKLIAMLHYLTVLEVMYLRIAKVLRRNTVHRLVLTAAVIASKVLDDRLIPQVRWSVVGGISLHQLHGLELAFFFLMNGKCWITEDDLTTAGRYLEGHSDSKHDVNPMIRTVDSEIIWSSVGNKIQT